MVFYISVVLKVIPHKLYSILRWLNLHVRILPDLLF
jgi:hypothetical protein